MVVTAPPFITKVPPPLVVTLVNAVVLPMAPPKVVIAVLFTAKAYAPLMVLLKVTLAVSALSVVSAPKVTGPP